MVLRRMGRPGTEPDCGSTNGHIADTVTTSRRCWFVTSILSENLQLYNQPAGAKSPVQQAVRGARREAIGDGAPLSRTRPAQTGARLAHEPPVIRGRGVFRPATRP
jgi:hypothetical protein